MAWLSEDELCAMLSGCGFDFRSPVRELEKRFPRVADWGYVPAPVVPFRLTAPLGGLGVEWKIPVPDTLTAMLPASNYLCEFHPTPDARRNHDWAVAELTSLLRAPGAPDEAVNTYSAAWEVGALKVRVTTWPRELNRHTTNVYAGLNPYLWISANIYVSSAFAGLERVVDVDASGPAVEALSPGAGGSWGAQPFAYARRNSLRLERQFGTRAATVGWDASTGELVMVSAESTCRIPRTEMQRLELERLAAGRFQGSSYLRLRCVFAGECAFGFVLATGEQEGSLTGLAKRLRGMMGVTLEIIDGVDNG